MKKQLNMILGFICYGIGMLGAAYIGIWKMIILPIMVFISAFLSGKLSVTLVVVCVLKVAFSTTLMGLIWCIGYIGYNFFKGTEDPDWEAIEEERMSRIETEKERRVS